MQSTEDFVIKDQTLQTMKILWLGLLMSQLIIIFLTFSMNFGSALSSEQMPVFRDFAFFSDSMLANILIGAGIVLVLLSLFLSKIVPFASLNKASLSSSFMNQFIIGLAINEAGTIMGFVSRTIGGLSFFGCGLFAFSLLAFASRFPSRDRVNQQIQIAKSRSLN